MITITRLTEFSEAAVDNCDNLKSWEVVSSESELKDIIERVSAWPLLVTVLPSANGKDGNPDNRAEDNQMLFFVLKPIRESMTKDQRLELWELTQTAMAELKTFIHSNMWPGTDFHDILWDAKFENRSQDPEYNLVDCSGWSLVFDLTTDGL